MSAQPSENSDGGIGKGSDRPTGADLRVTFDMALSNKRKYPVPEFKSFVQSARHHIEFTADGPMIHKSAKGTDARHQAMKELASPSGGALKTVPVLRVFLRSL